MSEYLGLLVFWRRWFSAHVQVYCLLSTGLGGPESGSEGSDINTIIHLFYSLIYLFGMWDV